MIFKFRYIYRIDKYSTKIFMHELHKEFKAMSESVFYFLIQHTQVLKRSFNLFVNTTKFIVLYLHSRQQLKSHYTIADTTLYFTASPSKLNLYPITQPIIYSPEWWYFIGFIIFPHWPEYVIS